MSRFKSSIFNLQSSLLLATGLLGALAPRAQAVSATGGIITNYRLGGTNWTAHIFTNTAAATSIVFSVGGNVDVLVVAGGGGGNGAGGGNGGASNGGSGGAGKDYSAYFGTSVGSNGIQYLSNSERQGRLRPQFPFIEPWLDDPFPDYDTEPIDMSFEALA